MKNKPTTQTPREGGSMKVVINKRHGGFGLSPLAVKKIAERKGRPCYFFVSNLRAPYEPREWNNLAGVFMWVAFDIPNPNDVLSKDTSERWMSMSLDDRKSFNDLYKAHHLDYDKDRRDPDLIAVVEELGDKASDRHAKLKVIEIPDGTDYVIEEYDGMEWIAERHQTWD